MCMKPTASIVESSRASSNRAINLRRIQHPSMAPPAFGDGAAERPRLSATSLQSPKSQANQVQPLRHLVLWRSRSRASSASSQSIADVCPMPWKCDRRSSLRGRTSRCPIRCPVVCRPVRLLVVYPQERVTVQPFDRNLSMSSGFTYTTHAPSGSFTTSGDSPSAGSSPTPFNSIEGVVSNALAT